MSVSVENIVLSITFPHGLDLETVAKAVSARRLPRKFPGIVFGLSRPQATILLFRSGKGICTGAKNVEEAEAAVKKFTEELKAKGFNVEEANVAVQNMVTSADLGFEVDVAEIAAKHKCAYEPERFPGAVFKFKESGKTLLVFSSGKVVCVGAKTVEEAKEAVDQLRKRLTER